MSKWDVQPWLTVENNINAVVSLHKPSSDDACNAVDFWHDYDRLERWTLRTCGTEIRSQVDSWLRPKESRVAIKLAGMARLISSEELTHSCLIKISHSIQPWPSASPSLTLLPISAGCLLWQWAGFVWVVFCLGICMPGFEFLEHFRFGTSRSCCNKQTLDWVYVKVHVLELKYGTIIL